MCTEQERQNPSIEPSTHLVRMDIHLVLVILEIVFYGHVQGQEVRVYSFPFSPFSYIIISKIYKDTCNVHVPAIATKTITLRPVLIMFIATTSQFYSFSINGEFETVNNGISSCLRNSSDVYRYRRYTRFVLL